MEKRGLVERRADPLDGRPSKRAELGFLAVISAFIGLLGIGAIRRWRWTFWLIMIAFLFGVLRVPVSVL